MSNFSTVEMNNENLIGLPLSIIDNFFTAHNLAESKQVLREIQEQLFNKSYPYKDDSIQHDNIRYFFEKIDELIDAAHLLNIK